MSDKGAPQRRLIAFDTFSTNAVVIGTVSAQVSSASVPCNTGVIVKAYSGNAGSVYLSNTSSINTVTTSTLLTTSRYGFQLAKSESVTIPVSDVNKIWARATAADQVLTWLMV